MREAGLDRPTSPFIVGVLGSTGDDGMGSSSLMWSVSGDGAGLFEPIDSPDSSISAPSLTGGSFDNSSEIHVLAPSIKLPRHALTHDDLVSFD